jgi:hypothetical protein
VLIEKDICYSLLQLIGQKVLFQLDDFAAPSSDTNLIEHSEYISEILESFYFAISEGWRKLDGAGSSTARIGHFSLFSGIIFWNLPCISSGVC